MFKGFLRVSKIPEGVSKSPQSALNYVLVFIIVVVYFDDFKELK